MEKGVRPLFQSRCWRRAPPRHACVIGLAHRLARSMSLAHRPSGFGACRAPATCRRAQAGPRSRSTPWRCRTLWAMVDPFLEVAKASPKDAVIDDEQLAALGFDRHALRWSCAFHGVANPGPRCRRRPVALNDSWGEGSPDRLVASGSHRGLLPLGLPSGSHIIFHPQPGVRAAGSRTYGLLPHGDPGMVALTLLQVKRGAPHGPAFRVHSHGARTSWDRLERVMAFTGVSLRRAHGEGPKRLDSPPAGRLKRTSSRPRRPAARARTAQSTWAQS